MKKVMFLLALPLVLLSQEWVVVKVDSFDTDTQTSIAIDSENCPAISYVWRASFPPSNSHYVLKYAYFNGSNWEFSSVESVFTTGGYPPLLLGKLCIDAQNHPHIAYAKDTFAIAKYAYYDGNTWQISEVESTNLDVRNVWFKPFISMVLSQDGTPHIAYPFAPNPSYRGVRYAFKDGADWSIQTVWEEEESTYWFPCAIDLDNQGRPVIAFGTYSESTKTGRLLCARFNGQNWQIDTVVQRADYEYIVFSVKVDGADRTHILYFHDFRVFYAVKQGNSWAIEHIYNLGYGGVSGDMVLDANKPKVVFTSTLAPLIYAWKTGAWEYEEIPLPPPHGGLYPSLAQDNQGNIHVSCYSGVSKTILFYARKDFLPGVAEDRSPLSADRSSLKIYPNPAKGQITLNLPFPTGQVRLYDSSGKLLRLIPVSLNQPDSGGRNYAGGAVRCNLKGIKAGVYFLRAGKERAKLVVR